MAMSMAALESTLALWTERQLAWGPRQVAYFFTFIGVVLVITQGGLVGRVVRRLGEPVTVALGTALLVAGFAIVPVATTLTHVLVSGALIALGFGLGQPSVNAVISTNAPEDRQGEILGASQSAQSLARIVGPIFAGILFAGYGRHTPYIVATILLIVAFLLATRIVRHVRSAQESDPRTEAAE
jgi:DHA1 family tetracycline resistance protein-like MFS transporter